MIVGSLLLARCEQKELKIDARSVVAPAVARGRLDGGGLPGCSREQRKWSMVKHEEC